MGVGLSGSGAGGGKAMANEGVNVEAVGNHFRVRHKPDDLKYVYRVGEDGGIQKVTTVSGPK